jgi:drug/metabolite transporter (DMT)-like permease
MASLSGRFGGWLYQQAFLLVSFTYLAWAINIVLGRAASGHIAPVTLTLFRWGIATLILLPFAWPHLKRDWPTIRANLPFLTFLGVTATSGFAILSYWGLQYTEALNGLLIQCAMPVFIGFTSYILVGDRLSIRQMAGIALSLFGVLVVLSRGDPDVVHSISFNRGDLLCVASGFMFATYSALVRRRPPMHPISFLAVTLGIGAIVTIPLAVWEVAAKGAPPFDLKTVSIVVYIATFPSIIAYLCFNRGVELIGPNRVAALYPLIIVFGAAIAIVFLGERPQLFHIVGTVLIACGVMLAALAPVIKKP